MKDLVNKIKTGVKNVAKVALPSAAAIILSTSDMDAQVFKSDYKNHDIGGSFRKYQVTSDDLLEEKVFYNPVTKKDDRFYINYLDKEGRKLYDNDLDIAALSFEESNPMIELKSSEVAYIKSKGVYHFHEVEDFDTFTFDDTHVINRCPDQIVLLANGIDPTKYSVTDAKKLADKYRGQNYISQSRVKDYDDSMPETSVLELGNGLEFLVYPLPKDQQEEGKTNHILIPLNNENYWTYNTVSKKIEVQGTFYRGIREEQPAILTKEGGIKKIGTGTLSKSDFKDADEEIKKEISKQDKKKDLYLIFGASTNLNTFQGNKPEFLDGKVGIGYGPLAIVGNYGFAQDENVLDIAMPGSNGRTMYGKKDNVDVKVKGIALELHLLNKKMISPFIGGGINNWSYTTNSLEQIKNSAGQVLSENSNSTRGSENSLKGYVGLAVGKKTKLRIDLGYDTKTKIIGGIGVQVPINRK